MSHLVFVRRNNRFVRVKMADIQYVEAAGSYLKLVVGREEISLAQNLSQFLRKNPQIELVRIHRSFLVNLDWVDSFDQHYVKVGNRNLPIGASYRSQLLKAIHCI